MRCIVSFAETLLLFSSQLFGSFLRILVLLQGHIQDFKVVKGGGGGVANMLI